MAIRLLASERADKARRHAHMLLHNDFMHKWEQAWHHTWAWIQARLDLRLRTSPISCTGEYPIDAMNEYRTSSASSAIADTSSVRFTSSMLCTGQYQIDGMYKREQAWHHKWAWIQAWLNVRARHYAQASTSMTAWRHLRARIRARGDVRARRAMFKSKQVLHRTRAQIQAWLGVRARRHA